MDPSAEQRVAAYVPDLMDRSRLSAVSGIDLRFVNAPGELASLASGWLPDVVVIDLGRPGVIDALQAGAIPGRIIGFGSHVDTETLEAARAAGCHEVLPRSRFFADPGRSLAG
jgi:pantothenate kinase type III